jgi:hypothetical protein
MHPISLKDIECHVACRPQLLFWRDPSCALLVDVAAAVVVMATAMVLAV